MRSSSSHIFREGWELPTLPCVLHPVIRMMYQICFISLLSWLNLSIHLNILRIKSELHNLAYKALHDLVPWPVSYFSSWSLTLYTLAMQNFSPFVQRTMFPFTSRNFHMLFPLSREVCAPNSSHLPTFFGIATISSRKSFLILQDWIRENVLSHRKPVYPLKFA